MSMRAHRILRVGGAAFWLVTAAFIVLSLVAAPASAAPTPAPSPCQLRGNETTEGVDLDALVAEEVPTFAGMYVDEGTRTLYVLLTDWGQSLDAAVYALQTIVRSPDLCVFTPVALPAKYSYSQLKAWDDRLIQVHSIPGTISSGIDDAHNMLEVGVEDLAKQGPLVEAKLVDLGIPLEAVNIVQQEPVETAPIELMPTRSTGPLLVGMTVALLLVAAVSLAFLARRKKRRLLQGGNTVPSSPKV